MFAEFASPTEIIIVLVVILVLFGVSFGVRFLCATLLPMVIPVPVVPQLILGTDRIATIPRRFAELHARQVPLKIFKLPRTIPHIVETMQWHTFRNSDPALQWMRRILKSFAA